jgi:hypothetical protein
MVKTKDGKVNVPIYEKPKEKNVMILAPTFNSKVDVQDIKDCFTGETKLLPDFMGDRYQYNSRVASNEIRLIEFVFEKGKAK